MKKRSALGVSLVELTIGATILIAVIGGADRLVAASSGVAESTNHVGTAGTRAQRGLHLLGEAMRRGSLASVRKLSGANFNDGDSDSGFQIRQVLGFNGSAVLDDLATYRLDIPAGATEGSIVRSENGVETVLVNGVTSFNVNRTLNVFIFDVRTRSGPGDDRARNVHAGLEVSPRNP